MQGEPTGAAVVLHSGTPGALKGAPDVSRPFLAASERVALPGRALDAAAGIVFRDLKPENLLLDEGGHLKICDFGAATDRAADSAGASGRSATFVGTADYIPPEALGGDVLVGFSWDIWSLGVIGHQMLSGKPPFRADTEYLTFLRIKSGEFQDPPGRCGKGMSALIANWGHKRAKHFRRLRQARPPRQLT